jgi:hypothetical protein
MTNRQTKCANLVLDHRNASGFLKPCRECGIQIYLKQDSPGCWRPYESWAAGSVDENEWRLHQCGERHCA